MVKVIGVRFENAGKLYFFDPGENWPTPGDRVVVDTNHGLELGEVVLGVREINDENLSAPLNKVIRVANAEDVAHHQQNKAAEKEAYEICQKKITEHKLDMKLVSVEYTFDNSKILFYFTANGRVDFRSLVKDLASVFKTRIELRQIGVRDEAKMLGGLGPCGRPICCGTFLGDFQPVSIKMAKEQNLSLNPTKISGVCGRLMCCLKYEEDTYEQIRKSMPRIGREVMTPDGPGVVWDLNIIKESVRVRIQKGDASELKDYPNTEVQRIQGGRRPMPKDEAEIPDAPEADEEEEQLAETLKEEEPAQETRDQRPREPRPRDKHRNENAAPREDRKPEPKAAPAPVKREVPVKKEMPVKQENKKETVQENKQVKKPAASPWKAAVEEALRAARGDDSGEKVSSAPTEKETLLND